jgi:ribonucleoside-diphosphate reductase alpha chain
MRNATVTTIAPTGSISVIAGCSSGIEPLFGVAFVRNIMEGTKFFEINDLFEQEIRKRKLYSIDLVKKIAKKGSVQHIDDIPKDLKDVFVTAHDLHPEVHVRMQAAFQAFTDNAVSKTVNLSADASIDDIKNIYLLAHELKCKGITVYRYGIKKNQVFSLGEEKEGVDYFNVEPTYSGGCPVSGTCEM